MREVCAIYRTAMTKLHKPAETPLKREEIQEVERRRALRYLQELQNRMGDA